MPWWIWVIGGLLSLSAEIFIPIDFYLFFVGIAGIITGVLTYFGLIPEAWMQWVSCGVLSLILLLSARRRLLEYLHANGVERAPELEGEIVTVVATIPPGGTGKGEARGTRWNVINRSENPLTAGQSYTVAKSESLSLVVEES